MSDPEAPKDPAPGGRAGASGTARRRAAPWSGLPPGFGVLWTTVAVDLVGFGIVIPLLPLYARRLGAGPQSIGLLLAAFSAAQLVGAPLLGRLSDRFGRKPVLVLALAGTAVASVLTGVAGPLWLLFAARLLDGATGGSVAVAQAAATDVAAPGQRARLLGLLGAAYGVGFVVGPAIGGLAAIGGPRLPFFVAGAIAALNAGAALRRLPETRTRRSRRQTTVPGVTGVGALAHVFGGAARRGLRSIAVPAVLTVLVVGSFGAFEVTFPLFGHRFLGFGLAATGAVFALMGLVAAGVQGALVRPMVDRFGDAGCLRAGLACEALGLVLLAAVRSRPELAAPLVLVTAGQSLCTPTLGAIVAGRVHGDERGGALGLQQGCASLGRILGPALGGAAYGLIGPGAPLVGGGLVVAGALVFSLLMRGGLEISSEGVVDPPLGRLPLSNNG